ncbi:MAG: DUF1156 domain-containing protein, partial [Gammaproteobacteria bacterium]|nr:DUF1156 domain-containing protein [Gammaproteobacteria bacterium]
MTVRLIEKWLPIAALGEESVRERRSMTALPPTYYLHVWWARRPLVASRAAIMASLLPEDADRKRFMHMLGIHGDPVASRQRIDMARRKGERFEGEAYSYKRAFIYSPDSEDFDWFHYEMRRLGLDAPTVLDPTAGGGSIPFEAERLGLAAFANELNPVAALILHATLKFPLEYGLDALNEFKRISGQFLKIREERLSKFFPREPLENSIPTNYLWARTITCPYCDGLIPLSPNWRLAPDGTGVRLHPHTEDKRRCSFEIVHKAKDQSEGTVARGTAVCPYPDCGRVVNGAEIKSQAQAGQMGEQLYVAVYKQRVETVTKTGRKREKWVRGYRAPRPEDDNSALVRERLAEKLEEWEAFDRVPTERFPEETNDDRPIQYGMPLWRDLFSPRQLLCHGTGVEVFQELWEAENVEIENSGREKRKEAARAAFGYLALSLDKLLNYNSRMSVWMPTREVVANTF